MDYLKNYFSDYINITKNNKDRIKTTVLFSSFSKWCEDNNIINTYIQRSFNTDLKKLGISKKESNGNTFFPGILFKPLIENNKLKTVQNSTDTVVEISKEVENIPKRNSKEVEIIDIIKPVIKIKKVFIKFKDFILHVPTYITIKGNFIQDNRFICCFPFSLKDVINMRSEVNVLGLDVFESSNLYKNFNNLLNLMLEKKFSLQNSVTLIFTTGNNYSQFQFQRNLLVCDTFDEFYSYCIDHSLPI